MMVMAAGMALCYVLGAIPAAHIAARLIKGIDIRQVGSGNVGATNTLRSVGKFPALCVLLFDIFKGYVCVTLIAGWIVALTASDPALTAGICGFAAVVGHIFNVFLSGKGGKGVATGLGVIAGMAPVAALSGVGTFVVVFALSRIVSLGSIAACIVIPIVMIGARQPAAQVTVSAMLALLIIVKHAENIRRLLNGQEHRFGRT